MIVSAGKTFAWIPCVPICDLTCMGASFTSESLKYASSINQISDTINNGLSDINSKNTQISNGYTNLVSGIAQNNTSLKQALIGNGLIPGATGDLKRSIDSNTIAMGALMSSQQKTTATRQASEIASLTSLISSQLKILYNANQNRVTLSEDLTYDLDIQNKYYYYDQNKLNNFIREDSLELALVSRNAFLAGGKLSALQNIRDEAVNNIGNLLTGRESSLDNVQLSLSMGLLSPQNSSLPYYLHTYLNKPYFWDTVSQSSSRVDTWMTNQTPVALTAKLNSNFSIRSSLDTQLDQFNSLTTIDSILR